MARNRGVIEVDWRAGTWHYRREGGKWRKLSTIVPGVTFDPHSLMVPKVLAKGYTISRLSGYEFKPEQNPRPRRTKKRVRTMTAHKFFMEYAGYATPPGRAASALALAKAEAEAKRRDWEYEYVPEQERYEDVYGDKDPGGDWVTVVLKDPKGETLASLGFVDERDRNNLRVVRAELAAEALGRRGNPVKRGGSAKFRHTRLRSPRAFTRRSFRVTRERKGVRVVVGKLKGERRRVRRGARKGRPVFTAQAVLKRKRNAPAYSEKKAWAAVHKIAARLAGSQVSAAVQEEGYALRELAGAMLEQLGRGVHINPMLAVFGANPPRRVVTGSDDVQGILYRHKEDGRDYVHPFGHGVKVKNNRDGSTVIRAAANARSGVRAIGLSDGSVLLRHPTKPIWKDF